MHTRRAGRVVARPLNCGVMRQSTLTASPRSSGMADDTVFVLGAGFTRAFVPAAPLLIDNYGIPELAQRFAQFPWATSILNDAMSESPVRVDLERLMTRLGGMPYDHDDARHELGLLDSELRRSLIRRIQTAKLAGIAQDRLEAFARFVVDTSASIVTFNYDDVLDQALWDVRKVTSAFHGEPYWHPDGGYGFFCRPSSVCVNDRSIFMDRPQSLLLKLHGSVNWRCRLGEAHARGPAALLHHETWLPRDISSHVAYEDREIESHLEPDPFIVPPVLLKSEISRHPVLRVVWATARNKLHEATKVVFIGYSLPQTDLAAHTLFRETLRGRNVSVNVVDWSADGHPNERLKQAYRETLGEVPDDSFDFGGASARIEREFSKALTPSAAA
jgi:hypothetical protein